MIEQLYIKKLQRLGQFLGHINVGVTGRQNPRRMIVRDHHRFRVVSQRSRRHDSSVNGALSTLPMSSTCEESSRYCESRNMAIKVSRGRQESSAATKDSNKRQWKLGKGCRNDSRAASECSAIDPLNLTLTEYVHSGWSMSPFAKPRISLSSRVLPSCTLITYCMSLTSSPETMPKTDAARVF